MRPLRKRNYRLGGDFTVIADFGHGFIDEYMAGLLVSTPQKFVALTCQSNASNWGYNLLTKYPRADYVVADLDELRLAAQDKISDLEWLIQKQAQRMRASYFAVTLGHEGCVIYHDKAFYRAPALATRVVDRLGSGDAFLAATAPLAYLGAPPKILALIGNLAGAIQVGHVGQKPLDLNILKRWIKGVLA